MSTARKILCSVLGFAAFLIAAILYSFIDSRVANKPEQNSPQAYGLDSLEYQETIYSEITVLSYEQSDSFSW